MKDKLARKERDYRRHKAEIIKSAESLFAELGYHNVTMEMIAKESEYCKGSLYNYFESKDILFYEMLDNKAELFMAELNKVVSNSVAITDKINAFVEFYLNFFSENIEFFIIAQKEKYSNSNFSKNNMMISLRKRYFDLMKEIKAILKLQAGKSEDELCLIATTILGILNGLVMRNLMYDREIEIEKTKKFATSRILKLIE